MKKLFFILLLAFSLVNVSLYAEAMVPGEMAPPFTPSEDDDGGDNPGNIKNAILDKITALMNQLNEIQTTEGNDAERISLILEIDSLISELGHINTQIYNSKTNSKNSNEKKLSQKNAVEKGDPVKVSVGSYVQNETDISSRLIEIKRLYDSENSIVSSIGQGWILNLDQRIILGIEPMALDKYTRLQNNYDSIKSYKSSYEKQVYSDFRISDFNEGFTKLNSKLSKCYSIEDEAKLMEAENNDSMNIQYINELLCAVNSKENKIEKELRELKKAQEELEKMNRELVELENEIIRYKNEVLDKTNERKDKNKRAMFKGSPSYYEETGLETLTVIDEEGNPHLLFETKIGSGIWKNMDDNKIISCNKTSSGYLLFESDGVEKYFDAAGFLIKIADRNKNTMTINRYSDEKISNVESSFGEKYNFTYNGNFIDKIENNRASEENVKYTYEGNRLVVIKDTDDDSVSMEYNQRGYLTGITKCDGSSIKFTYGLQTSDNNFLATETTNEEGFSERFEYNKAKMFTDYIDHDGNVIRHFYDSKHRPLREVKSDGTEIKYEYDEKDNLISINENGNIVRYLYDDKGNKISSQYGDGSAEYWSYDDFNLLTAYTDRDGVKEEYERDSRGNIIAYKKGGRRIYENEINTNGQIIKQIVYGQEPVETFYEYDTYGNLIRESCAGVKIDYDYDTRNRNIKKSVAGKTIKEIKYEAKKIIQKNYNGLETVCIRDGRKNIVKVLQKDTVTGDVHEIRIEYDKRHLPLKIYSGDGNAEKLCISYMYTPAGKIFAEIYHGRENWVKLFQYQYEKIKELKQFKIISDDFPNQKSFTQADINNYLLAAKDNVSTLNYEYKINPDYLKTVIITNGNESESINLFEYDCYGNVIKKIDGNGDAFQIAYSKAGRLTGEQSIFGGWYEYEYNSSGLIAGSGERNGNKNKTEYYPDGKIKSQTDLYGIVTFYGYDNRGRVNNIQNNKSIITYEYDSLDRVTKRLERSKFGRGTEGNAGVVSVEYGYSVDGRSVTVTEGGKYKTIYVYDAFNNLVKKQDGNNNERSFVYNSRNQLVESYDGYGYKTNYEYNALGLIERIIRLEGDVTEYSYNYIGLLTGITDACGKVYAAEYDKNGNLIKEKNRADSEKTYSYDNGGRLIQISCGGDVVESYEYENQNRNKTVSDGELHKYHYRYDFFGRLINEVNRNNLEQNYSYDKYGLLMNEKAFDSSTTVIKYSDYFTKRSVDYSDGSINCFTYDVFGNIVEAKNDYGIIRYEYDTGGKLIRQIEEATGEIINFEYDNAGNRIKLTGANRELCYTYGKNNELKEIFDNKQRVRIKLEYDKNGREIVKKFDNGTKEETLYDKAGRVIVKLYKTERGQLLWGEGYVYADEGKRIASVNNSGNVTLYQYNNKGQLESVFYPYSKEFYEKQKAEAEENGLAVSNSAIENHVENQYLSSAVKAKLIPLMNSMQYGLSFELTNLQTFIKESYTYDKNGNRKNKITPFGTIEYTYDKENCLLSSGSKGIAFIEYTYDKKGNLLSAVSEAKSIKYAYNSQNRIISCEQLDKIKNTVSKTTYAYDSFGRRNLVQDEGCPTIRTIYDSLSFDVIKQSPVFFNGLFTDTGDDGINWRKTGRPTGDRYRYLDEEKQKDDNRYVYLDDGNYKTENTRFYGERFPLIYDGKIAAQYTLENGAEYFSTDLNGSVSITTDFSGATYNSYSYDAFGNLIQGDLSGSSDFGYLSKQLDPTSVLYNYGYRDYSPASARFTTMDPIRDGNNWFTYCNNDPVNFVDLWGLEYRDRYGVWRSCNDGMYKIEASMNNHNRDKYLTRNDVGEGKPTYQCDDYVQTVLRESDIDSYQYLSGDSQQKTVADHIQKAMNDGIVQYKKENAPDLSKGEAYIVFMSDSPEQYMNHTGILRKSSNGEISFTHNSSNNATGGVSTKKFNDETAFQEWYDYNSFCYIKIKTK